MSVDEKHYCELKTNSYTRSWKTLLPLATVLGASLLASCMPVATDDTLILIQQQGSLAIGGSIVGDAAVASQHCDHGVAEYQIPPNPRAMNLLMWHSASAAGWKNRWDGGEGFQSIFVRRGYPVYIWDGPRVGRANWGCMESTYSPVPGLDQQNFSAWRLGSAYLQWFDGVQFPTDDPEAWNQATRARYQEFDTLVNIRLQADTAADLTDQIGPTVALTNSAAGMRALLAAIKSDNIKAIVAYENVGYIFPEGEGPAVPTSAFGPIELPLEDFLQLTKIPIQIIWGDNLDKAQRFDTSYAHSRLFVELVNSYGGNAEVVMLNDEGLSGNTHLPFADLNNLEVADLLSKFLNDNGLDLR